MTANLSARKGSDRTWDQRGCRRISERGDALPFAALLLWPNALPWHIKPRPGSWTHRAIPNGPSSIEGLPTEFELSRRRGKKKRTTSPPELRRLGAVEVGDHLSPERSWDREGLRLAVRTVLGKR